MTLHQKENTAVVRVVTIAEELQCELSKLQHIREQAAALDEDHINPTALDLLAHHVTRLGELAKQQSSDLATIDAIEDTVACIEAATHALDQPTIDRTQ